MTGIEYYTSLQYLGCFGNQLTAVDLSANTLLTQLDCHNNQLTALDLSKNTALRFLECSNNRLSALDLSHNGQLFIAVLSPQTPGPITHTQAGGL